MQVPYGTEYYQWYDVPLALCEYTPSVYLSLYVHTQCVPLLHMHTHSVYLLLLLLVVVQHAAPLVVHTTTCTSTLTQCWCQLRHVPHLIASTNSSYYQYLQYHDVCNDPLQGIHYGPVMHHIWCRYQVSIIPLHNRCSVSTYIHYMYYVGVTWMHVCIASPGWCCRPLHKWYQIRYQMWCALVPVPTPRNHITRCEGTFIH